MAYFPLYLFPAPGLSGQSLSVTTSTTSTISAFQGANFVAVTISTQNVYVTFDGSTPSSTNGAVIVAGKRTLFWPIDKALAAKFRSVTSTASIIAEPMVNYITRTDTPSLCSELLTWYPPSVSSNDDIPFPDEPLVAHETYYAIEGDSISSGAVIDPNTTPYGVQGFASVSASGDTNHVYAVAGNKLSDLEARAVTVDASMLPDTLNVLSILIGVNDMIVGHIPDNTFFDRLKNYCNARKAAGWRVIVCTILPAQSNTDFEDWRINVNGWIRADSSFYHGLADFGGDSVMGLFTSPTDVSLYDGQLHPTQHGQDLLAAIITPVLTEVFALNADPIVDEPTFSVNSGGYLITQTVTIETTTPDSRIKYTVNDSIPTQTHGTRYTGPVTISSSQTLRAVAYKYAYANSVIPSAYYEINTTSRPNISNPKVVFETYTNESITIVNRGPQFGGTSIGNSVLYGHPTFTSKGVGFAYDKYLKTLLAQDSTLTWLMIGQWDVSVNNIPIGNYTGVDGDNGLSVYTGGGGISVNAGTAGGAGGAPSDVTDSMNGINWNAMFITANTSQVLMYCPVDSLTVPIFTINGTIDIPTRKLRVGSSPFSALGGFEGPMNVAFFAAWPRVLSSSEISSIFTDIKSYLSSSRSLTVVG